MKPRYYAGIGSRNTPREILDIMAATARYLDSRGYTLRTGGAPGADEAFMEGATRMDIYLPWKGFNGQSGTVVSSAGARESVDRFHPAPSKLSATARRLLERDYLQVMGHGGEPASEFIVCWTPDGRDVGGTAQALRIARHHGIKIYNLANAEDFKAVAAKADAWLDLRGNKERGKSNTKEIEE